MEDLSLIIRVVEVVFMEVLVVAAVVALLIAVVRDIVEAKVLESRRRDQIAMEPEVEAPAAQQPAGPKPTTLQNAKLPM